ncbi:toxin-antitoxin system, toxin component [Streptomyces hygroscopicus]|uniref:DUF397 domain-containing protein n=1 Tax=Streptomyces hygroscopicus TaxID=1912 RepID=UPI00223F6948|nr:DUF397 domain-containing protein [Streptomyces hygroscopicus]MCW7943959.1 toxin-antitoxin system, toxin component [Streptomyces hygroscopicus]
MSALPRHIPDSTSLHGVLWLRSSRSTGCNNCVETARPGPGPRKGLVAVRDSKNVTGPALLFTPDAWEDFLAALD